MKFDSSKQVQVHFIFSTEDSGNMSRHMRSDWLGRVGIDVGSGMFGTWRFGSCLGEER